MIPDAEFDESFRKLRKFRMRSYLQDVKQEMRKRLLMWRMPETTSGATSLLSVPKLPSHFLNSLPIVTYWFQIDFLNFLKTPFIARTRAGDNRLNLLSHPKLNRARGTPLFSQSRRACG